MNQIKEGYKTSEKPEKFFTVVRKENSETKFCLFIVIEMLRLIFWIWYLAIIIVGVTLTLLFVEVDYTKIAISLAGSVNICAFSDYPPSTLVLPSMYALFPVLVFLYSIASVLRAWIAMEENKISMVSLAFYSSAFIYFFISSLIFATIFAVQPDSTKLPQSFIIHTLPFTNVVLSMAFLQIAVAWFNNKVAWKNLPGRMLHLSNYIVTVTMTTTSFVKIFQHINAFGGLVMGEQPGEVLENGWMVSVSNKKFGMIGQINDAIWMASAIIVPLCQSGYLTWKKFDTHGLILTIEDNRTAMEVYKPLISASDE